MDDLDRLYDRLIANIRDGFPHLLDRAFQLGDVTEHLVPYRLNRRELGFESVRQYEIALMRLAAGERGYLRADASVQDAMRRALASPEPDAALLRDHARGSVAIVRGSAAGPATESAASAGSAPTTPVDAAVEAPIVAPPTADAAPSPVPAEPMREIETPSWPPAELPPAQRRETAGGLGATITSAQTAPLAPRAGPTAIGGPCRYCGQALPEGRAVTYCPSCGQNVTVRHCPACSTELEVGWRFCITCGRSMDESEPAAAT